MIRSILCVFFLCLNIESYSQFLTRTNFNENILKARVKQIDEFISRFNLEEDWEGKKITQSVDDDFYRKSVTILLSHDVFVKDGNLTELANEFIESLVANKYHLHYEDTTWVAKMDCNVSLNGNKEIITIYLKTHKIKENEYIWIIKDVSGKIFNTKNADSKSKPFISPSEHEISFIGLIDKTYIKSDMSLMFGNSYIEDKKSMLACLLNNGLLKITSINHLSFDFSTIPNWNFTVSRIEKDGVYNTGWLITNLNKLSTK